MHTRLLSIVALAITATCFLLLAPAKKPTATTRSYLSSQNDYSVMYRRRHGADDGDEDDVPGGARAGDDDRDQDAMRQGEESRSDPTHTGGQPSGQKTSGGHVAGDGQGKPKPDPIGR